MSDETPDVELDTDVEPTPEPDPNAVTIILNGREVVARKGELVIDAAERHGEYIPRFCYHPRLTSVGKCRQCLVEIDTGRGPAIQPSCMVPVADKMAIETRSETVKRTQEGILELLLANHPLDCPVCDKGGECPLQDQAVSHGPGESRYVEAKRTYDKPIAISDHILLDRERCILCDRCTRFADEVAGDKLIHFTQRGNFTQVATFPDDPFASYFSGNIAQICPVGALTAKPYRFKARPWDLEQVVSTCGTCSTGCRISVHSSRDELLRVQGVDVDAVNQGWLCDRGRFSFQATGSDQRLTEPVVRTDDGPVETSWSTALALAAQVIGDASTIGIIGGSRSTNEGAYAWAQLADTLKVAYRDSQVGDGLPADILSYPRATIDEAAAASTVILLGPDLKEELPLLYLRMRGAAVNGPTKVIEFSDHDTGMTRYAWRSIRYSRRDLASVVTATLAETEIADQLAAGPVVIIAGRTNLAVPAEASMAAVRAALEAVPSATVLPAMIRGNVVGALQLGLAPSSPDHDGLAALTAAANGELDLLILVGNDPLSECPDTDLARRGVAGAGRVIATAAFPNSSTASADIVLPSAAFGEESGSTTNFEGRVSLITQKVTVAGTARPDWMIAASLADALGHDLGLDSVDQITDQIAANVAGYDEATAQRVADDLDGVIAIGDLGEPVVREVAAPAPSGYDYRLVVDRTMYDQEATTVMSESLTDLIGTTTARLHPADFAQLGVGDGADVHLISSSGKVVAPITSDNRVDRHTVWIPFRHQGSAVGELIDVHAVATDVRIERLS